MPVQPFQQVIGKRGRERLIQFPHTEMHGEGVKCLARVTEAPGQEFIPPMIDKMEKVSRVRAINLISHHRIPDMTCMSPDLVLPPGYEADKDSGKVIAPDHGKKPGFGNLTAPTLHDVVPITTVDPVSARASVEHVRTAVAADDVGAAAAVDDVVASATGDDIGAFVPRMTSSRQVPTMVTRSPPQALVDATASAASNATRPDDTTSATAAMMALIGPLPRQCVVRLQPARVIRKGVDQPCSGRAPALSPPTGMRSLG